MRLRVLLCPKLRRKEVDKVFDNRYMTKGVQHEISLELQLFMWNCIDTLKEQGKELDYLQVFELSKERADDVLYQKIEHRQEVLEYSMTYRLFPKEVINAKVFVIDDGKHSAMILSNEY